MLPTRWPKPSWRNGEAATTDQALRVARLGSRRLSRSPATRSIDLDQPHQQHHRRRTSEEAAGALALRSLQGAPGYWVAIGSETLRALRQAPLKPARDRVAHPGRSDFRPWLPAQARRPRGRAPRAASRTGLDSPCTISTGDLDGLELGQARLLRPPRRMQREREAEHPGGARPRRGPAGHARARRSGRRDSDAAPSPRSCLEDRDPGGVELVCGRGRLAARHAVGLLDQRDGHARRERRLGRPPTRSGAATPPPAPCPSTSSARGAFDRPAGVPAPGRAECRSRAEVIRAAPAGSTSAANRRSSSPAGSAVSPVCTGDGCTIVLAGAVSQWKRSDCGIVATRPPSGRPSATATSVSSCARTSAGSQPGASAASSASSSAVRAPRKRRGRQKRTTPALTASPRSTRGTTRTHRVLERLSHGQRSASSTNPARSAEPRAPGGRRRRRRPPSRRAARRRSRASRGARRAAARAARRPPRSSRRTAAARGRGSPGSARRRAPRGSPARVVDVQRRAVVDQPQAVVPAQQVRVARACGRR